MKIIKLILVGFILLPYTVVAQGNIRYATIKAIRGNVQVRGIDSKKWEVATVGKVLKEGDVIKTGTDGWALLAIDDGKTAEVEVSANSQLLLSELKGKVSNNTQKTLLDLAIGKILIKVQKLHRKESKFEVKTPTSIVGVRGTVFAVEVESLE